MKRRWERWRREAGNTYNIQPTADTENLFPMIAPGLPEEWKRMAKVLEQMGLLTEMDMAAFAGYCQAYARWKEAEEFLTQHGSMVRTPNGYLQQVPQVSIAQTNMKIMLKFCEQFGLTPSARSRIVGGENVDEEDEMEKLLEGGGC